MKRVKYDVYPTSCCGLAIAFPKGDMPQERFIRSCTMVIGEKEEFLPSGSPGGEEMTYRRAEAAVNPWLTHIRGDIYVLNGVGQCCPPGCPIKHLGGHHFADTDIKVPGVYYATLADYQGPRPAKLLIEKGFEKIHEFYNVSSGNRVSIFKREVRE